MLVGALLLTVVAGMFYWFSRGISRPCEEMVWVDLSLGLTGVSAVVLWLWVVAWLV